MNLRSALSVVVLCLACGVMSEAQSTKSPFTITIDSPNARVIAGSEVRVYITETNISDHDISAGTYGERRAELSFDITVCDSSGNAAPETQYGRTMRTPTRAPIAGSLQPGKSFREYAILSRLYDLSLPGTYTVQVRRKDTASQLEVKSNTISIAVIP